MLIQKGKILLATSTLVVCTIFASIFFPECAKKTSANNNNVYRFTEILMGTVVDISIFGATKNQAQSAAESAFKDMKRLEKVFSPYDPTGELYALNESAYIKPFAASPELCSVIKRAIDVCRASGRAFDPTFFALGIDFKDGTESIPDEDEIQNRLKKVDCSKVKIDKDACKISFELEGMKIGLGGIAKGFIADEAARILSGYSIDNFIINAGGDMIVRGSKGNNPWRVGIKNPLNPDYTFSVLEPKDRAIATSGNYYRFGKKEGKMWGHIIDPRTGETASESLSATVCAVDLTTADAWATALFVLGTEGIKLLESIGGIDALLITKEKTVVKTKNFDTCAGFVSLDKLE